MTTRQDPKQRPRAALTRGAALTVACMIIAVVWAANRPPSQGSAPQATAGSGSADAGARTAAPESISAKDPAATAWPYDVVVERNLFMPPGGRATAEPVALPPLTPMPIDAFTQVNMDGTGAEPASSESQPSRWVYAGYATMDGNPVAIVEDSDTKLAEFLRIGQMLDDFLVSDVTPDMIQLTRDDETTALRISEAFTATPLNEPPTPTRQAGGDQGGRGRRGFQGGPFQGDFFRRVLPMLRDNPEFADQARRFLDDFSQSQRAPNMDSLAPLGERPPEGESP